MIIFEFDKNQKSMNLPNTTLAQKKEMKKSMDLPSLTNERVWTFFLATLILNAPTSVKIKCLKKFLNEDVTINNDIEIWFEAEPLSPRKEKAKNSEGNSKIDVAFGGIKKRGSTESGIEFSSQNDWVCFVEAKLFSDCSAGTEYDPFRNQLARIIENLICFQDSKGNFPERIYFTLLTPRIFKERPFYKLYGFKYFEYQDRNNLKKEFELSKIIPRSNQKNWQYPSDTMKRLKALKLNWVTYEEIFEEIFGGNIDLLSEITDSQQSHRELPAKIKQMASQISLK